MTASVLTPDALARDISTLSSQFQAAAGELQVPKKRRPAPFSIRLTQAEREWIEAQAAGEPIGSFIKARALDKRQVRRSSVDRQLIATVLSELGRSRLSQNLNQIATHLNTGTIEVTPSLIDDFREACETIRSMRQTLITALGIKAQ